MENNIIVTGTVYTNPLSDTRFRMAGDNGCLQNMEPAAEDSERPEYCIL